VNSKLENIVTKALEAVGLREHVKHHVAKRQDSRLARQIRKTFQSALSPSADSPQKVLFFTVQGRPNMLPVIEGLMARSLTLRQAQSTMVACDRILPACDLPFVTNNRSLLCKGCGHAARQLCGAFGLPVRFLSEFITEEQIAQARQIADGLTFDEYFNYDYLGVDLGRHVYSAVLRYLLKADLQNDEATRTVCRNYMASAIMMGDIAEKMFSSIKPDCVVMHHGIYLTTGVFADFTRKHGIRLVVFTPAYRKNTFLFSHDATYHKTLQAETDDVWASLPFEPEHEEQLDEYLESRRWGSQDFITYHPNPMEDRAKIIAELSLDAAKPTVGLFTNLVWDGQVVFFDHVFDSMLDWLLLTIGHFTKNTDKQLIVRIHPAEVKGAVETRQKILPEICKRFPSLPSNIKIIDSSSDISTYTLSEVIDAAVVYTTKVGLEFAVKGLPVIVGGEAFYRNKGFTWDIETAGEYFDLLDNLNRLDKNDPQRIAKARKYAYYYFFRRFIPFAYTEQRTWNNVSGLRISSAKELGPGRDEHIDLICEGILRSKPFVIEQPCQP